MRNSLAGYIKHLLNLVLSQDQWDGIDKANNPSKLNYFVTKQNCEEIYKVSNGLTKTTSDDFVDKLTVTTELGSGISKEVIIDFVYSIYNSVGNAVMVRVMKNDMELTSDYCHIAGGGNNTFRLKSGFIKETLEGTNIFKIQFKRDIGGEAKIKQTKLLFRYLLK